MVQSQNDLKYEMFHNILAPSSIIKSKTEIFHQKTHYWNFPFCRCPTGHTGKWGHHFSILDGTNKELWTARVEHNTGIKYYQGYLVESFKVLNFNFPENSIWDSIQKAIFSSFLDIVRNKIWDNAKSCMNELTEE